MIWFGRVLAAGAVALAMVSFLPTLFGRIPLPNLILVVVVVTSLAGQWPVSLVWAAVGGAILDILSPGHGFYTLVFVALAGGIRLLRGRSGGRTPLGPALLIMAAAGGLLPLIELLIAGQRPGLAWVWPTAANLIGLAIAGPFLYGGRRSSL